MDSFHLPRPWSHSFMFVLCQHEGGCTRKFYMILRGFSAVYLCKVKLIGFSLYKTTSQWISGLPKMPKSSGRISWGDSLDRAAARCSIPGKWFSPRTPVRHPGLKLWLNPSWTAFLWWKTWPQILMLQCVNHMTTESNMNSLIREFLIHWMRMVLTPTLCYYEDWMRLHK